MPHPTPQKRQSWAKEPLAYWNIYDVCIIQISSPLLISLYFLSKND